MATNITVRGSEFGGKLERTPFSLESRTPHIFSIGLPFYGEVVARSFDGSARSDLEVSVRVITSWRELGSAWGFEEKFRADSEGRVAFAIPPFPRGRRHVAVFVTVAKPKLNVTNAPGQLFLSNPSLYLFLTEVFSMLDVGLQILPLPPQTACQDRKIRFRLQSNIPLYPKKVEVLVSVRGSVGSLHVLKPTARKHCCRDTDQNHMGHFKCARKNNSTCTQKIQCLPGWFGTNCAFPLCPSGCFRGSCVRFGRCRCDIGWRGTSCDRCVPRRGCRNGYCLHGNDCVCLSGFTGFFCDKEAPSVSHPETADRPFQVFQHPIEQPKAQNEQELEIFEREINLVVPSYDLFPEAFVVVFMYANKGKKQEILTARAALPDTSSCLSKMNPTAFSFGRDIARPGDSLTAALTSSGRLRLCALSITDSALNAIGDRGVLSLASLSESVKTWLRAVRRLPQEDPALRNSCPRAAEKSFRFSGNQADVFQEAGLFALSSTKFSSAPCEETRRKGVMKAMKGLEDERSEPRIRMRSFFPSAWYFDLLTNPAANLPLRVPDSLTNWRAELLCVTSRGIGVSPPTDLKVTQALEIKVVRPSSLIRGEIARFLINVQSLQNDCAQVLVTAQGNSTSLPLLSAPSNASCLCRFGQVSFPVFVRAASVGIFNFSASALAQHSSNCGSSSNASTASDAVFLLIRVHPEGVPKVTYRGDLLCPKPGVIETFSFAPSVPEGPIVPGSLRISLGWSGSVLGAAAKHLAHLLRLPSDTGEQNMASVVPSISILDFLRHSGREHQQRQVVRFAKYVVEAGFQRQLRFRHHDGSFSAFGPGSGPGSTWLTAFVLKSFLRASRHVTIDLSVLRRALSFLTSKQQKNGCFREDGEVFSPQLQGALKERPDPALLTAFVLTALQEARNETKPSSISSAVRCLRGPPVNLTTYDLALRAFSLSTWRPNAPQTLRLQKELQRRVHRWFGFEFWSSRNISTHRDAPSKHLRIDHRRPGSESRIDRTSSSSRDAPSKHLRIDLQRPGSESRIDQAISSSSPRGPQWNQFTAEDVETTAYALLSKLVTKSSAVFLFPIARWLSALQSDRGSWFSTQDTAVALSALGEFAMRVSQTEPNLWLNIRKTGALHSLFKGSITRHNELLFRQVRMDLGKNVTFQVRGGSGCLLINIATHFNVPKAPFAKSSFRLKVRIQSNAVCSRAKVGICLQGDAGLAVMIARLPSGWKSSPPQKEGLRSISSFQTKPEGFVAFLKNLSKTPVCANFEFRQEVIVKETAPMRVEVVNYYSPAEKLVELHQLCSD